MEKQEESRLQGIRSRLLARGKTEVDMTRGGIVALLLNFAAPLLLGNIFQQLYNTVDTWVVGNYVGKNAFSAVGTLSPIINTIIGFFIGFSNGACVIISRHFGAGDKEKVQRSVHTFVAVTLILCVVFTILGIALTPLMLDLIKSPAEVRSEQYTYLSIYFAGVTGLLLYNMGSAILRAVGNSVYPFLFLVVSALLNTAMDLVFVIAFDMGTAGVAYATIAAQLVSAILVMAMLCTAVLIIPVVAFAPSLVRFFIDESEAGVIHYGTLFLRMISPFYVMCCLNQIYGGALRGAGEAKVSMVIMLGSFVLFRQIYLFVVSNYVSNTVVAISLGYPFGWLLCSILMLVFYKRIFKDERLLKEKI